MFYRPGGTSKAINRQQDKVYVDYVDGATDWLPVNKGDEIAINITRASLTFRTPADSTISPSPLAYEAQVLMEMRTEGGAAGGNLPIDTWQNIVVATARRAHRAGWVRLRVLSINTGGGDGIVMAMQVSRTGESGAVT